MSSMKSKARKDKIFAACLMAYPILHFLVFYVFVNINSVLLALQSYDMESGTYFFDGFTQFKAVFDNFAHDLTMRFSLKNSIIGELLVVVLAFPLHLVFSYVIYKKIPLSGFFQVILFLPNILSSVVMSLLFERFINVGFPNIMEQVFNFSDFPNLLFQPKSTFPTIMFYTIWLSFGSRIILYTGAMGRVPQSIIEYGQLEGISLFKEFIYVIMPAVFSTLTIYLISAIAGIFTSEFYLYNFFGEEAPIEARSLGYQFYILVVGESATPERYPYCAAAGVLFTLVAAPLTLIGRTLLEKYGPDVEF